MTTITFPRVKATLEAYDGEWAKNDGKRRWRVFVSRTYVGRITDYGDKVAAYLPESEEDGFSYGRAWCNSIEDASKFLAYQHEIPQHRWEQR